MNKFYQIPAGYRKLRTGERVKSGDKYKSQLNTKFRDSTQINWRISKDNTVLYIRKK